MMNHNLDDNGKNGKYVIDIFVFNNIDKSQFHIHTEIHRHHNHLIMKV